MKIVRTRAPLERALLDEAAAGIASGGTLIFPTDTVYGIGCDPENTTAIAAIFAAKRRPADRPLAIHVADPADAGRYAEVTAEARAVIDRLWPGPVAIVLNRKPDVCEAAARGGPTISLRCPQFAPCEQILRAVGPLAATSANISGSPAYAGEHKDFSRLPDATLAIITGPTPVGRESTILDCSAGPVRIIREGAIRKDEIARVLRRAGLEVAGGGNEPERGDV